MCLHTTQAEGLTCQEEWVFLVKQTLLQPACLLVLINYYEKETSIYRYIDVLYVICISIDIYVSASICIYFPPDPGLNKPNKMQLSPVESRPKILSLVFIMNQTRNQALVGRQRSDMSQTSGLLKSFSCKYAIFPLWIGTSFSHLKFNLIWGSQLSSRKISSSFFIKLGIITKVSMRGKEISYKTEAQTPSDWSWNFSIVKHLKTKTGD